MKAWNRDWRTRRVAHEKESLTYCGRRDGNFNVEGKERDPRSEEKKWPFAMTRASEKRIKINARERRVRECEEKKGEHQRAQCPLIVGPTPKKPRVEHPQDHL